MDNRLPASLRGRVILWKGMIMSDLISKQVLELWNRYKPTIAVDAIEYDRELNELLGTNLAEIGTDCISRQQAINALDECYCGGEDSCGEPWVYKENAVEAIQMIEPIPSAQPNRGKWIYCEDSMADSVDGYRCDHCGFFVPWDYTHKSIDYIKSYKYCPYCGADMRGEQE